MPSPLGIIKAVKKVASTAAKKPAAKKAPPATPAKKKVAPKMTASKSVGKRAPSKPPVDREARQAVRRAKAQEVFVRNADKTELGRKGLYNPSREGTNKQQVASNILKRTAFEKSNRMKSPDGTQTRDGWGKPLKATRSSTAELLRENRPVINKARAVVKEANTQRKRTANKQAAATAVGVGGLFAYDYAKNKRKQK